MASGIYKIRNIINNDCYIGSAISIKQRWKRHKKDLQKGIHHSIIFQRAWNKYGEKNFIFEIIEDILEKSNLIIKEQHYIDILNPKYNIYKIAGSCLGVKQSKETRLKNGIAHKGQVPWNKGIPCSEETKKKISIANKGKLTGEKCHFFGKESPQKTKIAVSKANKGNTYSLGHVVSIKSKKLMSLNRKNHKLTNKQIAEIKRLYESEKKISIRKISLLFNISYTSVWRILNNKTYCFI